jgi:FecR protein
MTPSWEQSPAKQLVEQARRVEHEVPAFAEARVLQAVRRRRTRDGRGLAWRMFFAGAGCAACLALALLVVRARPEKPFATQLADGAQVVLRAGEALRPTRTLSLVEMNGVARLVAGAGARAVLDRDNGGSVQIRLDQGTVLAHVLPRSARAPFFITTPRFTARVVGTVLRVVVAADGASSIAVGHGTVEVTPMGGAPVLVHSGEHWPATAVAALAPGELEGLGSDNEGVTAGAFSPPPKAPPATRCLGTPDEMIRCYVALAETADAVRAESALYEAGFIAWREHEGPLALAIWERQRTRYPHGLLHVEAQTSVIDALVAAHRSREAKNEIERLLANDPDALRADEMHFVLGTLYHELDGDCRRAAPELAVALRHGDSPWANRARMASAACGR